MEKELKENKQGVKVQKMCGCFRPSSCADWKYYSHKRTKRKGGGKKSQPKNVRYFFSDPVRAPTGNTAR